MLRVLIINIFPPLFVVKCKWNGGKLFTKFIGKRNTYLWIFFKAGLYIQISNDQQNIIKHSSTCCLLVFRCLSWIMCSAKHRSLFLFQHCQSSYFYSHVVFNVISKISFCCLWRLLFIDASLKDDWGTLCMGKNEVIWCHCALWNFPCDVSFLIFSFICWLIYEPTKIYNSINRAKIINFSTPRPFPPLNWRQHAFHISSFQSFLSTLFRISHFQPR